VPEIGHENEQSDRVRRQFGHENEQSDRVRRQFGHENEQSDRVRRQFGHENERSDQVRRQIGRVRRRIRHEKEEPGADRREALGQRLEVRGRLPPGATSAMTSRRMGRPLLAGQLPNAARAPRPRQALGFFPPCAARRFSSLTPRAECG